MPNSRKNEAVVLTLRKRYSTVRRGSRNIPIAQSLAGRSLANKHPNQSEDFSSELPSLDPWSDVRSDTSQGVETRQRTLTHRLSFDDASGVIVLPEDGHWLVEDDDSDSEEDYGSTNAPGTSHARDGGEASNADESATPSAPAPLKQRHGTYYHHPEKRRQTIPGAFPRS